MSARSKADDLVEMYSEELSNHILNGHYDIAKKMALMCVDEILKDNPNIYDSDRLNHKFWKNVKHEIEILD